MRDGDELILAVWREGRTLHVKCLQMPDGLRGQAEIAREGTFAVCSGTFPDLIDTGLYLPGTDTIQDDEIASHAFKDATAAAVAAEAIETLVRRINSQTEGLCAMSAPWRIIR